MNNTSPGPGQYVALGACGVLLVASFLDWLSISEGDPFSGRSESFGWNAWSDTLGISLFPTWTLPALLGLGVGGLLCVRLFSQVQLPDRILNFTWPQLGMVAGLWAFLNTFSFLMFEMGTGDDSMSRGIGLWLSILASIALLAGSAMEARESAADAPPATPQTF
jgi:hypothetical protein